MTTPTDADELEDLRDKLHTIKQWCEAYPLDIFPEPNLKRARIVLEVHGISLDAISASSMRHVLKGIINIIEKTDD